MKNASRKNFQDNHFYQLSLRMREGAMIIAGSIAVFLLISFMTYHHGDPGWSTTGAGGHVANAGGYVGAWLADSLLYFFGYFAYIFPILLIYCGWYTVQSGYIEQSESWQKLMPFRLIGLALLLIAGSGVCNLQFSTIAYRLPYESGGILGSIIADSVSARFNTVGTTVILLGLGSIGIMFLTGMSWLKLSERAGLMTLAAFQKWQELRRQRKKAHLLKMKQKPIRTEPMVTEVSKTSRGAVPKREAVFFAEEPQFEISSQKLEIPYHQAEQAINSKPHDLCDKPESLPLASALASLAQIVTADAKPMFPVESPILNTVPEKTIKPESKVSTESFKAKSSALAVKIHEPAPHHHKPIQTSFIEGELPSLALLDLPLPVRVQTLSHEKLEIMSRDVELRLKEFGIEVQVVAVHPGPVITRFEMRLAPGVKVSRISGLAKDLARSLSVMSVRIVDVIPGKAVVGLEVPNEQREIVRLSEILSSSQYEHIRSPLALALGKDIAGHPVVVDLAKMPHLLVAGTTGSGKSVGVNAMLLGMLYKATPKDLRLILVDPKMLELSIYEGIPHLLTPVVVDMKEAANALRWCVAEMERRYRLMAGIGVRNLAGFNQKIVDANERGESLKDPTWRGPATEEPPLLTETLPYVVVVIDEFADLMMVVGKKVEQLIARIAQKARAAGIHLLLATQRPSVDVITGLIKANIPTRIAFQVSSKIDSRTVLDQGGAEQLLGHGDMLYLPPGTSVPVRVHGAFVADDEVHRVVEDWRNRGTPQYIEEITSEVRDSSEGEGQSNDDDGENDPLYDQAVHIVTLTRRASISNLQRRLKIGYNRAARLIEDMEKAGVVSEMESNGSREVLAPPPPE